jgi:hypothetical protein
MQLWLVPGAQLKRVFITTEKMSRVLVQTQVRAILARIKALRTIPVQPAQQFQGHTALTLPTGLTLPSIPAGLASRMLTITHKFMGAELKLQTNIT